MIRQINIENYKSIDKLEISLGSFNVFIGENGCGKSNILEAIAFAAAATNGKVENDFLAFRGVRPSEPIFFRSGFEKENLKKPIEITLTDNKENEISISANNDNEPFSKWTVDFDVVGNNQYSTNFLKSVRTFIDSLDQEELTQYVELTEKDKEKSIKNKNLSELKELFFNKFLKSGVFKRITKKYIATIRDSFIIDYIIFAPENYFLRNVNISETYVEPLGYRGEGLLKLIKIIKRQKPEQYKEIISHLNLINWFSSFEIGEDASIGETEFKLSDKFLEEGLKQFDIRNSNEGFLFLLFYLTLFISDYTPNFFSIDNIDTALNPKLCSRLIALLAKLSKEHNKQVILTTHNPSVLDGINLNDDSERLFVISRNKLGKTRAVRIERKEPLQGETPTKLSEQFLRGYIGGLPKNF